MMKGLFSRFRRKLDASTETTTHPDLKPPSESGLPHAEYLPEVTQAVAGSAPDEPADTPAQVIEDSLHPDLHVFEPELFAADPPDNPRVVPSIRADVPASGQQTSTAKSFTEFDAENEVSAEEEPDPDPVVGYPTPDASNLICELDLPETDNEYDVFTVEEDELAEQIDDPWEDELAYEVGEGIEGAHTHDASFDLADFVEPPNLDSQAIESEAESAQWEDLLDLALYEQDSDEFFSFAEEDTITQSHLLDDYAARLVSQMRSIRLDERSRLQARLRAILDEFPFASSYRALSRLVRSGNSLEELEDACELKRLWRESPWLWSHRKFNRMQRAWEIEERQSYRSALSWKLALALIRRVGRVEAERRVFEDWRNEWLQMQPEHSSEGVRIDPGFWSYPAFLSSDHESIALADSDSWYYEEPIDIHPWSSFRLEDGEGEFWRFEPKDGRCDTGFLSIRPRSKRAAKKEESKAEEVNKDA